MRRTRQRGGIEVSGVLVAMLSLCIVPGAAQDQTDTDTRHVTKEAIGSASIHINRRTLSVTLELHDADLYTVLRKIFTKARVNYVLAQRRCLHRNVTFSVRDAPLRTALIGLLNALEDLPRLACFVGPEGPIGCPPAAGSPPGPTYSSREAIYSVGPSDPWQKEESAGEPDDTNSILQTPVTLRLRHADVRHAIRALMVSTRRNYVLDAALQGEVSIPLKSMSLRTALDTILHNPQLPSPYVYRVDTGIFIFSPPYALQDADRRDGGSNRLSSSSVVGEEQAQPD